MRTLHRFALFLPLLAACGTGPLDPGAYTLEGTWRGTAFPLELSFDLEQDGDHNVTGTGVLRGLEEILETAPNPGDPAKLDTVSIDTVVTGTVEFDVGGTWDHPDFELDLTADGYAPSVYDAAFIDPDSVRGTLQGSGFSNPSIVLTRQPTQP